MFTWEGLIDHGPDSSFGEVHKGSHSEPNHLEDEVKDQEDEVEDVRDKWRVRREGRKRIKLTDAWDMDEMTRTNTWANVVWQIITHARKHEKNVTCKVFCSNTPLVEADWFKSFFSRFSVGSLLWLRLGSLIEVASVHSCPICSVKYTSFSDISHIPQRMGSRSGLPVPTYPLRCTSPRSSQFWVANTGSRKKRSWNSE